MLISFIADLLDNFRIFIILKIIILILIDILYIDHLFIQKLIFSWIVYSTWSCSVSLRVIQMIRLILEILLYRIFRYLLIWNIKILKNNPRILNSVKIRSWILKILRLKIHYEIIILWNQRFHSSLQVPWLIPTGHHHFFILIHKFSWLKSLKVFIL